MARLSGPKRREKQKKIRAKNSNASDIRSIKITSNKDKGKKVDVSTSTVRLQYYESILQDALQVSVAFVDSGNSVRDGLKKKTVVEGLPIVPNGKENVLLKFFDNSDEVIELTMYLNDYDVLSTDSTKELVTLQLCSKEFLTNEDVRINERFDGPISEHVKLIITDEKYLNSDKDIDIEDTQGDTNFTGRNKKCFFTLNKLAQKSVPEGAPKGNSAGFFFFETSEGFKFKSIDSFFGQEAKKAFIFNQTPDMGGESIPEGYDGKALTYETTNKVNAQKKDAMGAYNTRIKTFDPYTMKYTESFIDSQGKEIKMGGKELPKSNEEFDKDNKYTRTVYKVKDTGSLNSGSGTGKSQEQLKKSGDENLEIEKVVNQSIMRYNQLFAAMTTITIPGDFTLHAGDAIWVDAVSKQEEVCADDVDKKSGGLYVIADLCHYLSQKQTFTKLNLIRDSTGRDASKRKRAISSSTSKPAKSETAPDVISSFAKRRNARRGGEFSKGVK